MGNDEMRFLVIFIGNKKGGQLPAFLNDQLFRKFTTCS